MGRQKFNKRDHIARANTLHESRDLTNKGFLMEQQSPLTVTMCYVCSGGTVHQQSMQYAPPIWQNGVGYTGNDIVGYSNPYTNPVALANGYEMCTVANAAGNPSSPEMLMHQMGGPSNSQGPEAVYWTTPDMPTLLCNSGGTSFYGAGCADPSLLTQGWVDTNINQPVGLGYNVMEYCNWCDGNTSWQGPDPIAAIPGTNALCDCCDTTTTPCYDCVNGIPTVVETIGLNSTWCQSVPNGPQCGNDCTLIPMNPLGGTPNFPLVNDPNLACGQNQGDWWCDPTGAFVSATGSPCIQSPTQPQSYFTGPSLTEQDCIDSCYSGGGISGCLDPNSPNFDPNASLDCIGNPQGAAGYGDTSCCGQTQQEWCCGGGITGAGQCIQVPVGTCNQQSMGTGYAGGPFIDANDCNINCGGANTGGCMELWVTKCAGTSPGHQIGQSNLHFPCPHVDGAFALPSLVGQEVGIDPSTGQGGDDVYTVDQVNPNPNYPANYTPNSYLTTSVSCTGNNPNTTICDFSWASSCAQQHLNTGGQNSWDNFLTLRETGFNSAGCQHLQNVVNWTTNQLNSGVTGAGAPLNPTQIARKTEQRDWAQCQAAECGCSTLNLPALTGGPTPPPPTDPDLIDPEVPKDKPDNQIKQKKEERTKKIKN